MFHENWLLHSLECRGPDTDLKPIFFQFNSFFILKIKLSKAGLFQTLATFAALYVDQETNLMRVKAA